MCASKTFLKLVLWSICGAHAQDAKVSFQLFEVPEGTPPRPTSLSAEEVAQTISADRNLCATIRQMSLDSVGLQDKGPIPTDPCQLVAAEGLEIQRFSDLAEGMHVYVVPFDRQFVWPTYELGHQVNISHMLQDAKVSLETISIEPRIFRLHNWISQDEMVALKARIANMTLERSTGGIAPKGNNATNGGQVSNTRTSTNAWDTDSDLSMMFKRRAHKLLRLAGNFEKDQYGGLQIVHYGLGQFYDFHQDWLSEGTTSTWNWSPDKGGSNRFATVFFYLSDTELGGATGFPQSTAPVPNISEEENAAITSARDTLFDQHSVEYRVTDKCREKFFVRPKAGDAILFYHQDREGHLDPNAIHGACPVLQGEKLGANLWIWNKKMFTHERAEGKGDSINVVFHNNYGETLNFFWVQWQDPMDETKMELVSKDSYPPGGKFFSGTYTGHSFLAKTASDDKIVGKWEMKKGVTSISVSKPTEPVMHSEL